MHTPEGIQRQKKQEECIAKVLTQSGIDFKREHHVDFRCINAGTCAKVDFVLQMGNCIVFLEVDEDQHAYYSVSCEASRMTRIVETLMLEGNSLPILFVRYNPHAFSIDGVRQKKVLKVDREKRLVEYLQNVTFDKDFGIKYMFYDEQDGIPVVTLDAEYPEALRTAVI